MVSDPEHLPAFDYIGAYRYFLTFCTYWNTYEGPPKGGPYIGWRAT